MSMLNYRRVDSFDGREDFKKSSVLSRLVGTDGNLLDTPIWECFIIATISGDFGDGLLLLYPH